MAELRRSTRELEEGLRVVREELGEIATSLKNMWFVVLQQGLERLESPLIDRYLLPIVPFPPTQLRHWIQPSTIVIVADGTPFMADAAARGCGIISVRDVLDGEPTQLAKIIAEEIIQRDLRRLKHAWLLQLREDGQHDFRLLSESM